MTEKWIKDTGLVFALVFMLLAVQFGLYFLWASGALLVCLMFYPKLLTPLAFMWFKLAELLAWVMNRVFFGIVFYAILTPIGIAWRLSQGDQRSLVHEHTLPSAFKLGLGKIEAKHLVQPY